MCFSDSLIGYLTATIVKTIVQEGNKYEAAHTTVESCHQSEDNMIIIKILHLSQYTKHRSCYTDNNNLSYTCE